MAQLKAWIPLVLLGAWGTMVGCDDDRAVTDLGTAGDTALGGGGATGGAGDDAGGEPIVTVGGGGVGGTESPGGRDGGGAGGTAGATGGAGGDAGAGGTGPFECPSDIFALDGEPCPAAAEGMSCSDGLTDPCQFGHSATCEAGKWVLFEAFPAPCGGGGAGGAGGAAGASGS